MAATSMPGVAFWILAVVTIVSGFMVVSLRNIFHCAIFLIFSLTGVAGIFILLNAEFLAVAQVLIYVGAVAILMVFGIMLTSDIGSRKIMQTNQNAAIAFFTCFCFGLGTIALILKTSVWQYATEVFPEGNVMILGKLLMTEYMLPFEVVSILLLAALIGAITLARGEAS